jgi:hypothetical protein
MHGPGQVVLTTAPSIPDGLCAIAGATSAAIVAITASKKTSLRTTGETYPAAGGSNPATSSGRSG